MLPAQAGVILELKSSSSNWDNAPRAGGGDPKDKERYEAKKKCSPRRRG